VTKLATAKQLDNPETINPNNYELKYLNFTETKVDDTVEQECTSSGTSEAC